MVMIMGFGWLLNGCGWIVIMSRCGNTATRRCLISNPERRESTFAFGNETLEIRIGPVIRVNTLTLTLILGPFGAHFPSPGFLHCFQLACFFWT